MTERAPPRTAAADRLCDAARRVRRLTPNWNNPERFFEERSEIEHELRSIEREIR